MNTEISLKDCIAPNFYELHKELKKDILTEVWLKGGRGSCKSSFDSIEVILGIMKYPEAHAVGFRRFENEIRDSIFAQLEWATYKLGVNHLFKFNISPFKITYIPTGQMILFKGADNPKKIKSIKIPFGYIKWAWFEECSQFGGMLEIRNIIQSIFRGTTKNQIAMFSYNPPKSARSWVNVEVKVHKEGRVVHSSDYRDVPKDWLGETFLANAEHLKSVNEDAYDHEYLGKETGTGLEVFKNVTLRPITDKEISYFDYRYQGLDFGYTVDPLWFGEAHFDAKKKRLYLFFEISGIGMKYSKFTNMLSPEQLAEVTMADIAGPKDIDDLRDDFNMNVIGAEKVPGSVDHGVKWLQDLEEIIIDPLRCPLASTEFINYALDVNRYGETISKYPDKNNHCFIGETLISTTKGKIRIDQVHPGTFVITRKGPRQVTKVFKNNLPVITTKLLNGKSLTLTDTHDIITKEGKVMFKDLTPSNHVYYEVDECGYIEMENRKLQYLKVKNTEGIQIAKDVLTDHISKERFKTISMNTCMLPFTEMRMEMFQRVVISIIKIGILSIMRLPILFALMVQSICQNIQRNTMKGIKILSELISKGLDHLRRNGMQVKKEESGTQNTEKKHLKAEKLFNLGANAAGLSTEQNIEGTLDSVQTIVNQHGEEHPVLMMLKELVQRVVKGLKSTSTTKQSVAQTVYDLEIDEVHEYFANGLLVSNSIDGIRYMMSLQIKHAKIEKRKNKHKIRVIPVLSRWNK